MNIKTLPILTVRLLESDKIGQQSMCPWEPKMPIHSVIIVCAPPLCSWGQYILTTVWVLRALSSILGNLLILTELVCKFQILRVCLILSLTFALRDIPLWVRGDCLCQHRSRGNLVARFPLVPVPLQLTLLRSSRYTLTAVFESKGSDRMSRVKTFRFAVRPSSPETRLSDVSNVRRRPR